MSGTRKKNLVVRLKVHPVVYDFYHAQYGDTFDMKEDSVLSIIVPHVLTLKPKDYKPGYLPNHKYLNLIIGDVMIGSGKGCVYINAEHRHYISDRNQFYISRFLYSIVKNIYHNYMLGYMRSNPNAKQKTAIFDFCEVYGIEESARSFETLKKSWDRSNEKREWIRQGGKK